MSKIYLITGANRGIGDATLHHLASRPDSIVLAGVRDPSALSDHTKALVEAGKVFPVRLAAGDVQGTKAAAEYVENKFGRLDVLILNAGLNYSSGSSNILEMDPKDIQRNIEVNTYGPLLVLQTFAPLLKASEAPQLVSISALSASMGSPQNVPINAYSTSKAATNFLAVALTQQEKWLKVQIIHPGLVVTDMSRDGIKAAGLPDDMIKQHFITPEQSAVGIVKHIDEGTTCTGMLEATPSMHDKVYPF